jgi:hypothetical protein
LAADKNIAEFICESSGKFAFVIHGWDEDVDSLWVTDTIRNLTYHRGGCVIFMDYRRFSMNPDYFLLTTHFYRLAELLARKIRQVTTRYENVFLYGFSFGARLCFEAGVRIGYQKIDSIHGCDPPGPGFDPHIFRNVDPKSSAKNVHCINTSVDKGTNIYNCHVNFRMGICGRKQIAATRKPFGSHGLCVSVTRESAIKSIKMTVSLLLPFQPFFYNAAFENDFISDNFYNCTSNRMATNVPRDFKMGYMETRRGV